MDKEQTKKSLEKEREDLSKQLTIFTSEDPFTEKNRDTSRNVEDNPVKFEEHERIGATTRDLKIRLKEVEKALKKLDGGNYGECENCGKKIELDRLVALPTAKYCLNCQKKFKNR